MLRIMPNCLVCQTPFTRHSSAQRYCSRACYKVAQRTREHNEYVARRQERGERDYSPDTIERLYQQALAANRASGRYQLDPWETRTSRLVNPYWDTRGI